MAGAIAEIHSSADDRGPSREHSGQQIALLFVRSARGESEARERLAEQFAPLAPLARNLARRYNNSSEVSRLLRKSIAQLRETALAQA